MLTHTEKIAAMAALLLLLAVVVAWLFHYFVLAAWYWPLVGRQWREDRQGPPVPRPPSGQYPGTPEHPIDRNGWPISLPVRDTLHPYFDPEPFRRDWDDEPSTDDDADAMIAAWHGDDAEHEQLAAVHPIYLDLSDDPDLIVWDAKQQADRCWEIVHVEFPRLRAELAGMWEAAA